MLSKDDNGTLCRVGPGTPVGNLFRRFWPPALLTSEAAKPDGAPKRLCILGEDLVAIRNPGGQVGIVDPSWESLVASDVPVITAGRLPLDLARAREAGIEPTQAAQGDLYQVRPLAATSPHREFEPFLDVFHARVMTLQPE